MLSLTLYSTSGCHLCEVAEALIVPLLATHPCVVEVIDIAEADALIERYGTRIPVLQRTDTGDELGWPFSAEDFLAFIDVAPSDSSIT